MADCDPLVPCVDVDGRILLQRTVYGPQFAFSADAGSLAAGAGLRPYVDLVLGVTWRSQGLCQGPPTSVMGLAPGEVASVGIGRGNRALSPVSCATRRKRRRPPATATCTPRSRFHDSPLAAVRRPAGVVVG